jgi:regulatory protein
MKITKIEQQKNNPKRLNIFLNNEFCFGVSQEALINFSLKKDKEISKKERKEIINFEQKEQAWQKSLNYLSYRSRSKKEIVDYLEKKEFNKKVIKKTVEKLEKYSYINDQDFLKSWIDNRKRKGKGPKIIFGELIQKGFNKEKIEKGLMSCYNQADQVKVCQREGEKYLDKKKIEINNYQDKQKLFRFLGQRGFDYDIIKEVLENIKNKQTN